MSEIFQSFGHKLYIDIIFEQLKTFICTTTRTGNESWGSIDKTFYDDDVLFAVTFAYICAVSNLRVMPKELNPDNVETKIVYDLTYDENWNLTRQRREVKV